MKKIIFSFMAGLLCHVGLAQETSHDAFIVKNLDNNTERFSKVAREIWENPELGYLEFTSSKILVEELKAAGFKVETGLAGMPTSFLATYDKGGPVIGFLAEYDALPGLSQDAVPFRSVLVEGGNGHGCGHNLFGTAVVASGVALKEWIDANNIQATIKIFGTPAEEGGAGKVYMVREGLFEDVDAVINWHPGDRNAANASTCTAVMQGYFKFHGQTSHAAGAPERGRSALDGVEAMNMMVNMMREHVDQESRIHYVITNGGLAANVVPDYAVVEYMIRHPDVTEVKDMWQRVIKAAEGAAMGTGTRVEVEVVAGIYGLLPNETLAKTMHKNLSIVGGVEYDESEMEFAKQIQTTFNSPRVPPLSVAKEVQPYKLTHFPASTDVGDVSYVVPTVGLSTATWVPGTAAHTWQAVAADGMSIGYKGMMVAAKTMALTGKDLILNPLLIKEARKEFDERLDGLVYEPLIGDMDPPLHFRADQNKVR
ncbi:amidohydrolase [Cecembia lonarensis]|uniref:Aminobenzoyl-glutamate utilization protein B n=1 Tax=Cecembia lonarensis (strain CCUG 58316 / KCTC 22772 / LW9) TaxID=1225176 RepID=K1LHI1_CECL9|nr:amidohydrolase [Cecembia lonarensis]EKB49688.1 Aminobenzoyl-glutamate utilization protein B [Cecembia lonarensis LW9]